MGSSQKQDTRASAGAPGRRTSSASGKPSLPRTLALVVILSVFWLLLSGRTTLPFFIMMAVSVGLVVLMNPERPFGSRAPGLPRGGAEAARSVVALFRYLGWLVWNVVVANVDVARRILSPSMPVRPMFMAFRTDIRSDVGQVMVANSITLTPGTVTVDMQDGVYLVHALHPDTAGAVTSGALQNVVAPIFGEGPQPAPEVDWGTGWRELRA
jgi:multicomponent Na+:H+ antiporter subunit E